MLIIELFNKPQLELEMTLSNTPGVKRQKITMGRGCTLQILFLSLATQQRKPTFLLPTPVQTTLMRISPTIVLAAIDRSALNVQFTDFTRITRSRQLARL